MSENPRVTRRVDCGRCHECGEDLKAIEGCEEEWCPGCLEAKRYVSHGKYAGGEAKCPYVEVRYINRAGKKVCREVRLEEEA